MKNIIVYGSRFGQFYLEALKRMKGIKIVGLLAKGSDRSYECARYYNIPLYTSLDEVEERVDVAWNSVPAFMEMFVDYLERFYKGEKLSINKILLSGDWIPVKLPEKICRFLKDVRIYSLGGATEASISRIYSWDKDSSRVY